MHTQRCFADHLGPWAIETGWLARALAAIKAGTLQPRAEQYPEPEVERQARMEAGASKVAFDARGRVLYEVHSGVGIVALDGPLMKFDSKYGGTNSVRTRQAVRAMVDDPEVVSALLRIDSPGGTVAGTAELAADVAALSAKKRTVAYIEDLGASAAYWVAAAAGKVFANEMALVGSIGVIAVLEDTSKMADLQGVKVHALATGALKSTGTPGTEITPEMLAKVQSVVDAFGERFFAAVKDARGLDAAGLRAVSSGEVWIAKQAKALGLIDAVRTWDEAFSELVGKRGYSRQTARARIALEEMD